MWRSIVDEIHVFATNKSYRQRVYIDQNTNGENEMRKQGKKEKWENENKLFAVKDQKHEPEINLRCKNDGKHPNCWLLKMNETIDPFRKDFGLFQSTPIILVDGSFYSSHTCIVKRICFLVNSMRRTLFCRLKVIGTASFFFLFRFILLFLFCHHRSHTKALHVSCRNNFCLLSKWTHIYRLCPSHTMNKIHWFAYT